jgi:hypothetical protein
MKRLVLLISLILLTGLTGCGRQRFTDMGDGIVRDNRTGLEWVKSPHDLDGNNNQQKWADAVSLCKNLSYAGHKDWRLPSRDELESLVAQHIPALPAGHPFIGVQGWYYWSGTSLANDKDLAWGVNMAEGFAMFGVKAYADRYVWPVRSGQ